MIKSTIFAIGFLSCILAILTANAILGVINRLRHTKEHRAAEALKRFNNLHNIRETMKIQPQDL